MIRKEINRLTPHWKRPSDTPEQTEEVVELKRMMFKYFASWFCRQSRKSKTGIMENWQERLAGYVKDWEKKNPRILPHLADTGTVAEQKEVLPYSEILKMRVQEDYESECSRLRKVAGEKAVEEIIRREGKKKLFDQALASDFLKSNSWYRDNLALREANEAGTVLLKIWLRESRLYKTEIDKAKAACKVPEFDKWSEEYRNKLREGAA